LPRVKDKSPWGNTTSVGLFFACISFSDKAVSAVNSPLLGVGSTIPLPVGDSNAPASTIMVTVAVSNRPRASDVV